MYALVGGVVCRALLLRWTLVNQRKLAIEQARQRRAAHAENGGGEEAAGAADPPTSAKEERDLATINIQTRRLIEYSLAVACCAGHLVRLGRRAAGPGQHERDGLARRRPP